MGAYRGGLLPLIVEVRAVVATAGAVAVWAAVMPQAARCRQRDAGCLGLVAVRAPWGLGPSQPTKLHGDEPMRLRRCKWLVCSPRRMLGADAEDEADGLALYADEWDAHAAWRPWAAHAPRTCCRSRPGRSARLLRALRHRHVGRRRQRRFRAARRRRRRRRDGRAQRLSLRRGCLGLALPVPHLRAQSHAGALSPRIRARSAACACRSCGCRGLSPSRFLLRPRRPHSAPAVAATSHVPGPMLARHMHKACAVAARPSTHGGRTPSLYCSESAGFLGHLAVPLSGGRTVSNGAAGSGAGAGAAGGAAGPSGGHAPAGGLGSGRAAGSACPPSPAPPPSMPPRGQGAG